MNDQMSGPASSAADYANDKRFLKIKTPLGADAVLLTQVKGVDQISKPFLFRIEFVTLLSDAKILTLLGQIVTLFLCNTETLPGGRPVNGLVRKLSGPPNYIRGYRTWRAEIVPQLDFLGFTADSRIFQNMSVIDIITDIFQIHGLIQYQFRSLAGTYPTLDYCVQYRETALNFVSRLMENVGLYYWHEHTASSHVLVIADTVSAAKPATSEPLYSTAVDELGEIFSLQSDYAFRPGTWTLKDYDFETPTDPLLETAPTVINEPPMTQYEVFDYPGGYDDAALGTSLVRTRIEYEESQYHQLHGTGRAALFDAGRDFSVYTPDASTVSTVGTNGQDSQNFFGPQGDPNASNLTDDETDGEVLETFFLLRVEHSASDLTHVSEDAPEPHYSNSFKVLPANMVFRPERVSRRPFVQGPQTAVVTGPPGEQIYTDEYGRVKVRFHWDRNPDADPDEQSSCWLRVSQIWANNSFGGIHIPRVGEEVIVGFMEGDPDRPIITGRVYNGDNQVPYALPANKTQSGIKSQSVPTGGSNEFRFEDKQGSEEVWLHAQKDFNRQIENDENATISGMLTETVTGAVTETYQDTLTQNVTNSITITTPVITYNLKQAQVINTPTTTASITNAWTTGWYKLNAYAFAFNAYGDQTSFYGVKSDFTILQNTYTAFATKNTPIELDDIQTNIQTIQNYVKSVETSVQTATTEIKQGVTEIHQVSSFLLS